MAKKKFELGSQEAKEYANLFKLLLDTVGNNLTLGQLDAVATALVSMGYRKEKVVAEELLQKWYNENHALEEEQDYVLELAAEYGVTLKEVK